ncbi:hypothetical protein B0F90DRAFT_1720419 [Multifurca ochricompacta]|uniref:Secreted protein n=1 Tax=Multifurca ochricompacta TaxID=376703 RepID=A0AAD4M4Y2_9AGAM|nr:hypothetical protein B0F90DRAFT_1720419 [Multifurca ochricompacta]
MASCTTHVMLTLFLQTTLLGLPCTARKGCVPSICWVMAVHLMVIRWYRYGYGCFMIDVITGTTTVGNQTGHEDNAAAERACGRGCAIWTTPPAFVVLSFQRCSLEKEKVFLPCPVSSVCVWNNQRPYEMIKG